jgi:hypothetical protein
VVVELDGAMNEVGRSETEDANELWDTWTTSRPPFIGPRRREMGGPQRRGGGHRVRLHDSHFSSGRGGGEPRTDGGWCPLGSGGAAVDGRLGDGQTWRRKAGQLWRLAFSPKEEDRLLGWAELRHKAEWAE